MQNTRMVDWWMVVAILGAGVLGCAVVAGASPVGTADFSGSARLAFEGDSTLHAFHGHAATEDIRVHLDPSTNAAAATWDAAGAIPVLTLSTDHEKRDSNMYAMLHADAFPKVAAVLEDVPVPDGGPVQAPLRLRICSCEATVPATVSEWVQTGDGLTFRLQFEVSLSQFGLKPPSVLGLIKVADLVKVDCVVETEAAPRRLASR